MKFRSEESRKNPRTRSTARSRQFCPIERLRPAPTGKATFFSTGFCLASQTLSPKSIFVFSTNIFLLPILLDNIVM